MRMLLAISLALLPLEAEAYITVGFQPSGLASADVILLVDKADIHLKYPEGRGEVGPAVHDWTLTAPVVLKGGTNGTVEFTSFDFGLMVPPSETCILFFLKYKEGKLVVAEPFYFTLGMSGTKEARAAKFKSVPADVWSLAGHALVTEKDNTSALDLSRVVGDAPKEIRAAAWKELKDRKDLSPDMKLAHQNIGARVEGIKALAGFREPPALPNDSKTWTGGSRVEVLSSLRMWLDRGTAGDDYAEVLAFVATQNGSMGEAALGGLRGRTKAKDLPGVLSIFRHSPDIETRYICLGLFADVLGYSPGGASIPGLDDFKRRPKKYTALWTPVVEKAIAASK